MKRYDDRIPAQLRASADCGFKINCLSCIETFENLKTKEALFIGGTDNDGVSNTGRYAETWTHENPNEDDLSLL